MWAFVLLLLGVMFSIGIVFVHATGSLAMLVGPITTANVAAITTVHFPRLLTSFAYDGHKATCYELLCFVFGCFVLYLRSADYQLIDGLFRLISFPSWLTSGWPVPGLICIAIANEAVFTGSRVGALFMGIVLFVLCFFFLVFVWFFFVAFVWFFC